MKIKDFEQLSPRQRRKFLINSCQYLTSLNVADELITDLFYYNRENYYIEVYYSLVWEKFLEMNAFTDTTLLSKYLKEVDFSEVYESLGME